MRFSHLTSAGTGRRSLIAASLYFVAASCNNATSASEQRITSIVITPASLALTPEAARALTATLLDEIGASLPNSGIHWSTEDPDVATVSVQGIVTAVGVGKTQVAASKAGISAVVPITVSALPPALVRVSPASSTIFVGGRVTLTAEVFDAGGGILTGHPVVWSSGSPSVGAVNARGIVSGVSEGNALVSATAAGLSGMAIVSVQRVPVATVSVAPTASTIAVGQSLQLTASLLDAAGRVLTGRPITWSSDDQNAATVSANGLVRGRAKGTVIITSTSEGKTGTATITVP